MNITKLDKVSKQESEVTAEMFLEWIEGGSKAKQNALVELINGGLVQNLKFAFYIKGLKVKNHSL